MLWSGHEFGQYFVTELVMAPQHGKYWSIFSGQNVTPWCLVCSTEPPATSHLWVMSYQIQKHFRLSNWHHSGLCPRNN